MAALQTTDFAMNICSLRSYRVRAAVRAISTVWCPQDKHSLQTGLVNMREGLEGLPPDAEVTDERMAMQFFISLTESLLQRGG
jgi:hypothetical protein